jgi:hypothetical protein
MEEQYTIPQPDITPEQPVETVEQEPAPVEVFTEQASEPSDTAQAAPDEVQGVESAQEAPTEALAACDSCGRTVELFEVPHHQPGNATVWHYCARCKAAHEKELGVVTSLQELAQTHPAQADTPRVAGMLHQGMSVEDVKAQLDRERQPELEAEVV